VSRAYDQYRYFSEPGPLYEGIESLLPDPPQEYPVRYIAYYLPQFHPIPENDQWWGVGFTEWTNITRSLPGYVGHYQPRLPGELGFYNLSTPDAMRRQAELMKMGGVYGICIHNYWFNGKKVLEKPLNILLENRDIDIKFCINWANEPWTRRWDGSNQHVLLNQEHGAIDDVNYIESIIPAMEDDRYIKVNGRPVCMIYRPGIMPDPGATIERWRETVYKALGVNPYIIFPQAFGDDDPRAYEADAVSGFPPHGDKDVERIRHRLDLLDGRYWGLASCYKDLVRSAIERLTDEYTLFPGVCPSWDNEPRRRRAGRSFFGSTPHAYGEWLLRASQFVMNTQLGDERIVFINAWNEWAEGAYLEPDRHFGYAYLAETARTLVGLEGSEVKRPAAALRDHDLRYGRAKVQPWRYPINRARDATYRAARVLGLTAERSA